MDLNTLHYLRNHKCICIQICINACSSVSQHLYHKHTHTPTVQSSAPLSCGSPPGVSCGLFLAICVKLKNMATRRVQSADVRTHLSADRAEMCLRMAPEGRRPGATWGVWSGEEGGHGVDRLRYADDVFFSRHPQQAAPSWHRSAARDPPLQRTAASSATAVHYPSQEPDSLVNMFDTPHALTQSVSFTQLVRLQIFPTYVIQI